MPTYDYVCESCGDRFEHFQKMSSEPLTTCSKCGGHLKRLIGSGVGIIFKGSGFYCTDYRPGGASKPKEGGDAPKQGEATGNGDAPKQGESAKSADAPKPTDDGGKAAGSKAPAAS